MKISVAKTAGFCMGVQRAVEIALDAANTRPAPIYTYGPLIHNPQVLRLLEDRGIRVIEEIPEKGEGTVIIRAHGVPPEAREKLEAAGFSVVDASCPRVFKVQAIIRKHAREGAACIIVGDRDHPEVKGLMGFAGDNGHVVNRLRELDDLPSFDQAIVVAQTTQNTLFYDAVKKWVGRRRRHYRVFDTICDSTERRQEEAKRLAETVDAVVVVGGHASGNTQRLAEIVRQSGKRAFHVETEAELDVAALSSARNIGITAGASTPNWIIKRIHRAIESMPCAGQKPWRRRLLRVQRFLLLTNLYVALAAAALCYACATLQDVRRPFVYGFVAFLYVLSMHMLNNLTGMGEARYNDPDRADFYDRHKPSLTLAALASGATGLLMAASLGILPFLLLLLMSVTGLSYNLVLVPTDLRFKFRRLRDIPGSKTVLIALAWGVVTALFPVLSASGGLKASTLPTLVWSVGMVFCRTAFFDVLDMQGDRIVGKETIPLLLGPQRSVTLLRNLLLLLVVVLFASSAFDILPWLGLALTPCPILLFLMVGRYKRAYIVPGIRLEFFTESLFLLAGFITWVWAAATG
jgi:(E)-4-hydroxy-3-methyl-but-2-enyl pyrophosphate reductase